MVLVGSLHGVAALFAIVAQANEIGSLFHIERM